MVCGILDQGILTECRLVVTDLGPIYTRCFVKQYCDISIKIYSNFKQQVLAIIPARVYLNAGPYPKVHLTISAIEFFLRRFFLYISYLVHNTCLITQISLYLNCSSILTFKYGNGKKLKLCTVIGLKAYHNMYGCV